MKRTIIAILTITLYLWLCSLASWGGYWDTVTVDWCVSTSGNDANDGESWESPKQTIEAAIDAAQSGDVIGVAAGTYNESLRFKEGITLMGEGAATTRIQDSDDIVILARQLTSGKISGFTLAFTGSSKHSTVVLERSSIIITESVITGATYSGLDIRGDAIPQIINNEIRDNTQSGIIMKYADGNAIISGNVISGNGGRGISMYRSNEAQITYNTIVNNAIDGIRVYEDFSSDIVNNIIVKNGWVGISTVSEPEGNPNISYNNVWENGSNYDGIEKPETDISVDPLFVDYDNEDYQLQPGSPCRGAADDGSDMGAYSSQGSVQISLTILPSEATLKAGETQQFTADRILIYYQDLDDNGQYDPGEPSTIIVDENTIITMTWAVNGGIGTIDSSGLFTAQSAGSGKITASQKSDPSIAAETGTITVEAGTLAYLIISDPPSHITVGNTHQFTVTGEDAYENSVAVENSDVSWSIAGGIGTIGTTGLFFATTAGTGTVEVTLKADSSITAQSKTVTVVVGDLETLTISQAPATLKMDETHQFNVTGADAYGNSITVDSSEVTWSVTGGIGTIDTTGLFTATAIGTGAVQATLKADPSITAQSGTFAVMAGDSTTLIISQPPASLKAGETHQFTVAGEDAYGNSVVVENNDVAWSVDGDIGTISEIGLFTATTVGTGTLRVLLKPDFSIIARSEVITVVAGNLATLTISQPPASLKAGETHQFTLTGKDAYSNIVAVENSEVSWSSTGDIGTVDTTGLFSATTAGTGTMEVVLKANSSITAQSETVTVVAGALATLTISQPPASLNAGETYQFTLTGEDTYGNSVAVENNEVLWSVIGDIGTIDTTGLFSATIVGTGTVEATLKTDSSITSQSGTITVVAGTLAKLTISQAPATMKLDETHQFTITGEDAYGGSVPVENSTLSWLVNDEIGTVSATGLFTATTMGTGTVQATLKTDFSITAESEAITVVVGDVATLAISEARPTVKAGRVYQFTVTSKDAHGNSVSVVDSDIAWSVIGDIGTISETGLFLATTIGTGTAQATLVADPSITAQSGTITVVVGDLATLTISQPPATLEIGETHQFTITGEDAHSNSVAVENSEVRWSVTGDIGTIDRTGLFSATTAGTGTVEITLKTNSSITAQSETVTVTVMAGDPVMLTISQSPLTLKVGETHQFAVTGEDADGNSVSVKDSDITWSVIGGIGTVSETGLFFATTVGTGTVKVILEADPSITAQSGTITVVVGDPVTLTISQSPLTLKVGETHLFAVTGENANGNSVSVADSDVTWSVIGGIGTVSETGLFFATIVGTGTVKVTLEADPSITAQSGTITVVAGDLATLIVSQPPATLEIGETHQFTITGEDEYGNSIAVENSDVSWSVTGSIGTIDTNGLFSATAVGTGTVEITLKTDSSITAQSETVTVTAVAGDLATLTISQPPATLEIGETHQFTVTSEDADGNSVSVEDSDITWSVIGGIGTVSETGLFFATTVGTGTVKVTLEADPSITAQSGTITVVAGDLATLIVSQPPATLEIGETHQFTITGEDEYGNSIAVENSDVSWSVTGSIGTIDTNGLFSATAVGTGTVEITLKTNSSITAQSETVTVTVMAEDPVTLTIAQSPLTLKIGETHQFAVTGEDADGNSVSVKDSDITWSVIGDIGIIDTTGLFSATIVGTGAVEATLKTDSSITAQSGTITVVASTLAKLTISQAPATMKLDETHQFTITGEDAYGGSVPVENSTLSWLVNDEIGTVSATGLFTATTMGTGTVQATLKTDFSITAESEAITVVVGDVATLAISEARPTVKAGRVYQFTVTSKDAHGNSVSVVDSDIAWSVIGDIGTISETGLFLATTIGTGTAQATLVADPSITAQSGTITVVVGDLATLTISQPPATLEIGETHQFTITGEDAHSNSVAVENSEVRWSVTGDIGTIDRTGLFSATAAGTGTVGIILKTNPSITAQSETVTVASSEPVTLTISQSPLTLKVGASHQFAVTGEDEYGNSVSVVGSDVLWSVIGGIGIVSGTGLFSATTVGTGIVSVILKSNFSISAQSGTITVVLGDLATLIISQPPSTLMAGETHQFTVTGADEYGNSITVENSDVSWSIIGGIGTVDTNGLFSATTAGTGRIEVFARSGPSISASSQLFTVEPGETDIITVTSSVQSLPADGISQADITATITDAYGNLIKTETIDMLVSAGTGSLGTVANNGDGTYTATYTAGQQPGAVEIQASVTNGKTGETSITLTHLFILTGLPESGTVGETVEVTGINYEGDEIAGALTLDGEAMVIYPVGDTVISEGVIYADDQGEFVVQFVIPMLPGGLYAISVGNGETSLEITGKVAISPEWGDVGTTIEVTGDGFGQNESIEISFEDAQNIALAISDSDGTFQTSFSVDTQDTGQKTVIAVGAVSGISAEAVFELISAAISLEPATGNVGTNVEVTGLSFMPNADVGKLMVNNVEVPVVGVDGTTIVDGNIRTNDNGAFVISFSVPLLPGGDNPVAVGNAESSFVIEARISSVQPTSGWIGSEVIIAGDGFAAVEPINVDFGDTVGIAIGVTLADGEFHVGFQADAQEYGMNEITVNGSTSGSMAVADFELMKKTVPPSVTLISSYDEWESGILTVEATAEDSDGVISKVLFQYSLNGVTWHNVGTVRTPPYTVNWNTIAAGLVVQDTVWIKAVVTDDDDLTQEDVTENSFSVDNEPPETGDDHDEAWHNEDFSVTLTGDDGSGSGIASINYVVNDGSGKSVSIDGHPSIDAEDDENKIEYWSIDNAGNEEGHHILTGIKLDKTPPTLSDWTAQPEDLNIDISSDFSIRVRAMDNLSGHTTPQIAYHISSSYGVYHDMSDDGGGYWTFNISENWSDHAGETLYYKVKLEDNAGNDVEDEKSVVIRDKRASVITVNLPQDNEIQWDEDIIISGNILDSDSPPIANANFRGITVSLTFTPPGGAEQHEEKVGTISASGDYSRIFSQERYPELSSHTGTWRVKASWSGNDTHKGSESQEKTFEVVKIASQITWDEDNETLLEIIDEGSISLSGRIEPNPGIVEATLLITQPNGGTEFETVDTNAQGAFTFVPKIDANGEWEFTVSWDGNDEYDSASTDEHILEVERSIGKVIIVQGGGDSSDNETFAAFNVLANQIYEVFIQRRFTDDDIYYLNPERQAPKVDEVTSLDALEYAMTTWAAENLTPDLSLYIYVLTHNRSPQGLVMEKSNGVEVILAAGKLDELLDQLQDKCKDITVIIEACNSEEFIDPLKGAARVIIASSQKDTRAVVMQNVSFSKYLFDQVLDNQNLRDAFQNAKSELPLRNRIFGDQTPQLDADGNGIPNESTDMTAVEDKHIDGDYESEGYPTEPPEILQVCDDQELTEGESEATIWARVSPLGEGGRVWGTVVPPDFAAGGSGAECFLSDANLPTVDLELAEDNRYEGEYKNLDKVGTYTILIYAENSDGVSMPMTTRITVPKRQSVEPDGKLATAWGDMKNADSTEVLPSRSDLRQNYPNPFNPDTWMPYQLANVANVVINIYDSSGRLMRRLDLGYKPAGYYLSRNKAAYWDGRNEAGEHVASGVYFYSIKAGDLATMRKMIVMR